MNVGNNKVENRKNKRKIGPNTNKSTKNKPTKNIKCKIIAEFTNHWLFIGRKIPAE